MKTYSTSKVAKIIGIYPNEENIATKENDDTIPETGKTVL